MPSVKDVIVKKPSPEQKQQAQEWPIWQCEAKTFDWDYTQLEKCLIIEGQVTVTDRPEGEDKVSFGMGDYVVFPQGLKCIWKVEKSVKKYYTFE